MATKPEIQKLIDRYTSRRGYLVQQLDAKTVEYERHKKTFDKQIAEVDIVLEKLKQ